MTADAMAAIKAAGREAGRTAPPLTPVQAERLRVLFSGPRKAAA